MTASLPPYLNDLGTFLQTSGIGTLGTDIHFRGFDKDAINDITLLPGAGRGVNNPLGFDDLLYYGSVKILVRNTNGDTAQTKANQIFDLLNLVTNRVIGSTRFKRIEAVSIPWFVTQETNLAYVYSIDFDIEMQ